MKIVNQIFKKKFIAFFALVLLFVLLFILFSFRRDIDELKIENHSLYQYFAGRKVSYQGKIQMSRSNDNIVKLSFSDTNIDLDSTPIYYQKETKVIFPKNMSLLFPIQGKQYKLNYFSTLEYDFQTVYVQDRDLNRSLENAVVYDGNDLYFFIDPVTVTYGDTQITLQPMSYLIVNPIDQLVSIYQYQEDKFSTFSDVNDEVLITTSKYQINASLDLMYYNGKSRLLLKNIADLNNLTDK